MAAFNTSTRREDMSLRLRAQNMKTAKEQTKKLELESRKMEERLKELKVAMGREKEERERNGGGFWRTGQSGTLSSYASDVLDKPTKIGTKDSKRKAIKVLRDEPLDLPSRSSDPGTMKYIAKTSQKAGKDNRLKGPKCGQCEDRAACLTCVQCSEHYCSGCFAAFHLRGALKKHRSVQLQASGPRQCMSPRPTPPASYREPNKQSPAVGAVSSSISYQESERNGPEGASGSFESPSLLRGRYNEAESAASFQAALHAWRNGDGPQLSPRTISPHKSTASASVDTGTTMTDKPASPQIKFSHTISYADRLLLKQHRRTDPGGLDTPRDNEDYPSPCSSWMGDTRGHRTRESTLDISEDNRVNFSALYQASVSNINEAVSDETRPESSLSIVELKESPPKSRHMDFTDKYQVQEVGSFEAWQLQSYRKSPTSSRSASDSDRKLKTPTSRTHSRKSRHQVTVENAVTETLVINLSRDQQSPLGNSLSDSRGNSRGKEDRLKSHSTDGNASLENQEVQRPKSRPASRKSQKPVRPKSGRQSRPNSRAFSRAASTFGEGVLTKTPSLALHDIASRLKETDTQVYSPSLQDFFMAGVKPASQERTITPSIDKNHEVIKVSNRLYQMAPRSWRPDSSLGDVVPLEQINVDAAETVISFTYSAQTWQHPSSVIRASSSGADNPSRSGTPQRSESSPTPSQSRKSTSQWSSRPSDSGSGRPTESRRSQREGIICTERKGTTPRQALESGQTSRAIVMDGDDLTQYDDVEIGQSRNEEDEETLNQLEWELASESGRITADGHLSRVSVRDSLSDSGGSSRSSTPVIKLSMDKGFDINVKLRDDELGEDMDENANQWKDEQDVKDLH